MRWDAPAPTLTCRCFSISNGRYGHPEQHRAISLREAANLQSFPEDYQFFGPSQKALGAQIGNAVPVSLAEAVGRHIMKLAGMTPKKPVKWRKL
jgi:DNA (cytosine-5)-methyltransferase 1